MWSKRLSTIALYGAAVAANLVLVLGFTMFVR
jgi:hypothetical protein